MKNILIRFSVALATFLLAIFITNLFSFQRFFLDESMLAICPNYKINIEETSKIVPKNVEPFIEEYKPTPEGIYFPINERGLEPDTAIVLLLFPEDTKFNRAEVRVGSKIFEAKSTNVNSKKVIFRTKKARGIEYSFEGQFLKNGYKEHFNDEEIVLKGILRKFVKGKIVYKVKSKFMYISGLCSWEQIDFIYMK